MRATFNDRVIQIHSALEENAISHAFGGAIALIYAVDNPRLTRDIDLNIAVDPANAAVVLRSLPSDLPYDADTDVQAIIRDGQVRLLWEADLPVDLFFPQHRFHRVVSSRTRMVTFDGQPLPVISPTDLTVFKTLFNRTKDWADIEAMLEAGSVDTDEALYWVGEIVGDDHPSHRHLADVVRVIRPGARPSGDPNIWRR